MNCNFCLAAISMLAVLSIETTNADIVTLDFVTVADGRVQSSGVLGQELFTAEENVLTSRSGGNNVSDGLFEFDLSLLPADAVLTNASVLLRTAAGISNIGPTAPVDFFGFTGNGVLELSDESEAATLVAASDLTTAIGNNTEISVSLSDLTVLESVLSDSDTDDFFTLRSETFNFVAFRVDSLESSDLNAAPATLRLTFETSSIPEPSSMVLLPVVALVCVSRRRI